MGLHGLEIVGWYSTHSRRASLNPCLSLEYHLDIKNENLPAVACWSVRHWSLWGWRSLQSFLGSSKAVSLLFFPGVLFIYNCYTCPYHVNIYFRLLLISMGPEQEPTMCPFLDVLFFVRDERLTAINSRFWAKSGKVF